MNKLKKIAEKFSKIEASESNYYIGGGLDSCKFASRRHEDAKNDISRITLGKANQMFAKATGLNVVEVSEILNYAVPNMEWHHAGKLPKSYGGGMKKTYFLNSKEVVYLAENWSDLINKLAISKAAKLEADNKERSYEERKLEFLKANAERIIRVSSRPSNFYETDREMNGKYGWFSSYGKSYNMTEYYTGWKFESEEKLQEFYNL